MGEVEFNSLSEDIRQNGLNEKILLFQGKILDGRNRYRACLEVKVTPEFTKFEGDYDAAAKLSTSFNLTRRHLTKSQKAMVIAKNGMATPPGSTSDNGGLGIRAAGERYGVNHTSIYKAFYVFEKDKELAEKVLNANISVAQAEATIRERLESPKNAESADRQRISFAKREVDDVLRLLQHLKKQGRDQLDASDQQALNALLTKIPTLID